MKIKVLLISCLLSIGFISFAQDSVYTISGYTYGKYGDNWFTLNNGNKSDYVDLGHLIVRLNTRGTVQNYDLNKIGQKQIKVTRDNFAGNFYELEIPKERNPFHFAKLLEATNDFETILFNVYIKVNSVSNDPLFNNQWNLTKIDIQSAWDITKGSSQVVIAVIDVGGDYNHEDLIVNKWGTTGGYDFISNDNDPYPYDGARHGTAVAGIISAATNNGIGLSGIVGGWNSQNGVKIMHLRAGFLHQTLGETLTSSAIAQAIDWAATNGADIVNMSFEMDNEYSVVSEAINNAFNNYGIIFIASAGNYYSSSSNSWISFPANCGYCQGLISIGATVENDFRKSLNDGTDEPLWGSRYGGDGKDLDFVAPGIHIPTTDITGTNGYSTGNYHLTFNGTSAAAPHVAGLVGLIRSINSSFSFTDIRNAIINSVNKVSGMNGQNYHSEYGYGRINAYQALLLAHAYSRKSISSSATSNSSQRKIIRTGTNTYHIVFYLAEKYFIKRQPIMAAAGKHQ